MKISDNGSCHLKRHLLSSLRCVVISLKDVKHMTTLKRSRETRYMTFSIQLFLQLHLLPLHCTLSLSLSPLFSTASRDLFWFCNGLDRQCALLPLATLTRTHRSHRPHIRLRKKIALQVTTYHKEHLPSRVTDTHSDRCQHSLPAFPPKPVLLDLEKTKPLRQQSPVVTLYPSRPPFLPY